MNQADQKPEIAPSHAKRLAREAEALRANLARRKAQNRARQELVRSDGVAPKAGGEQSPATQD